MSNELTPLDDKATWAQILERFNVPKLIAGPAGEALSRLIGKAIDIPTAKLEQIGQEIKDKTAAKSLVTKALSEEVAKGVVADKELVQRAADNFLAKELRKQSNKEAIAKKTIEILAIEAKPGESPSSEQHPSEKEKSHLDEDWLNIFEQHAENATSERLRTIWSRTLAGEIRKPKSFSLQTLRFISELDQATAELFEKHASAIINDDFIPFLSKFRSPPHFADFLALEEAGLLSGSSGTLHKTFEFNAAVVFENRENFIIGQTNGQNSTMQIQALLLTKVGREIAQLVDVKGSLERAGEFAAEIPKGNLVAIHYHTMNRGQQQSIPQLLWSKPPGN